MYAESTSSSRTARCPVGAKHRRSISGECCRLRSRRAASDNAKKGRIAGFKTRAKTTQKEDDTTNDFDATVAAFDDSERHHHQPFDIFTPSSSADETVVGAEGVPQFIIEAERKAVPLRRPRLAAYAISSSVAAAQLVYILQQSSSLESPILAAASDVCVMIVGSLLWREELRGRAKRLKRIWKEAKERETAMTRAEQGLGETVWTARMRNVNKKGVGEKSASASANRSKERKKDDDDNAKEKEYYPTGITVTELKNSEKERRVVEVNGKKVLLQYFMDELYCVSNACPHLGISMQGKTALLSAGLVESKVEGSKAPCIVCPAHQTAFDMKSGEVEGEWCPKLPGKDIPVLGKALEKEKKPIEVFRTKVEEITGSILVAVP